MARYLTPHRSNPDLLGFGLEDVGLEAAGIGLTALISSQVTLPFAKSVVHPPAGLMSGLLDAASAGVTGWVEGMAARALDGHAIAHKIERGAALLTLVKVASAFIPSIGLTVNTGSFQIPGAGMFGAPTPVGGVGVVPQLSGAAAVGGPFGGTGAAGAAAGAQAANPMVPSSQQKYPAISGYGATSLQANLGL